MRTTLARNESQRPASRFLHAVRWAVVWALLLAQSATLRAPLANADLAEVARAAVLCLSPEQDTGPSTPRRHLPAAFIYAAMAPALAGAVLLASPVDLPPSRGGPIPMAGAAAFPRAPPPRPSATFFARGPPAFG